MLSWGPSPELAPLQNYEDGVRRSFQAAAPPKQILTPDAGPRITLPGPELPRKLRSLQEAGIGNLLSDRAREAQKGGSAPRWLLNSLVACAVLGVCLAVTFYGIPRMQAGSNPAPPQAVEAAPAASAPPSSPYELARSVEVSGFRFIAGPKKAPKVEFLVVNHSAADLANVTIYVTLRTASEKPGQPPLCRFSFRSPGLAPLEAKEMSSPIAKFPAGNALPDWQTLRAEVNVTP
ncbi:MAG TPA: hypothetical protein VFW83_10345 [Bryobacteraceae bacterium]|nr:hypothetical protein [Bryobacteraceae bacterium]